MRSIKQRIFTTLVFLILISNLLSQSHPSEIISFFAELYTQNETEYQKVRNEVFHDFCKEFNLDPNNEPNQEKFYKLYFMHDLFTGTEAEDFTSSGAFKIPYFWHWRKPNVRHEILRNSGRKPLIEIPASGRFTQYQSFADIDRTPSLFLSDLFTEDPKYYHSECGEFYTFGWCSEREMAFCLLLELMGYQGKIYQGGIHVRSHFWVEMIDNSGNGILIIISVDNTFDISSWKLAGMEKDDWLINIGSGDQIEWYNNKAKSKTEID